MPKKTEKRTPIVALIDHRLEDDSSKISKDFHISPLKDPCTSETRQYLLCQSNSKLYEVQSISHAKSAEYASFFVSNQIISNMDLHIVTPVDQLYLLLSHFEQEEKWQPWDQLVQSKSIPQTILQGLQRIQLKHFFEMNDSYGDDLILYKLKHDLVLSWLDKKVQNVKIFLLHQRNIGRKKQEADLSHNIGAVSSSFHLVGDTGMNTNTYTNTNTNQEEEAKVVSTEGDSTLSTLEQMFLNKSAVQIICEYLSPFWTSKLLAYYKLSEMDLYPIKKSSDAVGKDSPASLTDAANAVTPNFSTDSSTSTSKRSFPQHSIMSEADKLLQYTMGESGVPSSEEEKLVEAKKRKVEAAKSVALKKLEKVNTKGMKSMMSFFGSAKKK